RNARTQRVWLFPSVGPHGANTILAGTGFTATDELTVSINADVASGEAPDTPIALIQADAAGNFTVEMTTSETTPRRIGCVWVRVRSAHGETAGTLWMATDDRVIAPGPCSGIPTGRFSVRGASPPRPDPARQQKLVADPPMPAAGSRFRLSGSGFTPNG